MAACVWKASIEEYLQDIEQCKLSVEKLSKGIQNGDLSLHQFVEYLGPHLTEGDVAARVKGVKLLVDVCVNFKDDFLNKDEVTLLSIFLRDCLKGDDAVVPHALQGIKRVSQSVELPKEELISIMGTIFNDVFTQSRTSSERSYVFQIFQHSINHRLEDLQSMGSEFVSGFIQAVDGERDPHNLLLIFGLVPSLVRHFNIDPLVEELFEVTACYFPIDYTRSPKETRLTSKEDLILSLRACLAATPKFAEHCVPLLLEKLDSTLLSAKIDTYETLTACVPIYGSENMKTFNLQLWQSIRRDVFSGIPVEAENVALEALTTIIQIASTNVVQVPLEKWDSKDNFGDLMSKIIEECVTCINKPELKMAFPAAKLLRATSVASRAAFELVTEAILPLLLANFATKTEQSHRASVVEIINSFVKSCREISAKNDADDRPLLAGFKSPLLLLYNTVINDDGDVTYRISGVWGLLNLSLVTSLLEESELEKVTWMLSDLVVRCDNNLLRKETQAALATLSETFSAKLMFALVEKVVGVLEFGSPKESASSDFWDVNNRTHYDGLLRVLSAVTDGNTVAQVLHHVMQELSRNISADAQKAQRNLSCINEVAAKQLPRHSSSAFWTKNILTKLLELCGGDGGSKLLIDHWGDGVIRHLAAVFQAVVPHLEVGDSLTVLKFALDKYLHHSNEVHPDGNKIVFVIESILNCSRRELFQEEHGLFQKYIPQYLNKATVILGNETDMEDIVTSVFRSLASLINKIPEGSNLDEMIAALFVEVDHKRLLSSGSSLRLQNRRTTLLVWLTKALLMRGHGSVDLFVEQLFAYLANDVVSSHCCLGCDVITRDITDALNVQCHANVRFLYKQRFFVLTGQLLIKGFSEASDAVKHNYLIALVQQLLLLPKEIFKNEVPSMLPVLIQGLLSENISLLNATLHIIRQTLRDDCSCVEEYADTLIPRLLQLSANKTSMRVRVDALQCLDAMLGLPVATVVKHKKDVIQGLAVPLDDHKRLVRQAAVAARSNWFLLGSPGGS